MRPSSAARYSPSSKYTLDSCSPVCVCTKDSVRRTGVRAHAAPKGNSTSTAPARCRKRRRDGWLAVEPEANERTGPWLRLGGRASYPVEFLGQQVAGHNNASYALTVDTTGQPAGKR